MTVDLTVEQQSRLSRLAIEAGRGVEELARDAVDRYLEDEARFRAAVQEGIDAANQGDFVPAAEVWASVERVLQS